MKKEKKKKKRKKERKKKGQIFLEKLHVRKFKQFIQWDNFKHINSPGLKSVNLTWR